MPKRKQPIKKLIRDTVSLAQTKQFFGNFNIAPGTHVNFTFKQVQTIIKVAKQWYGNTFALLVQECFIPVGFIIAPGYEGSNSSYIFEPITWAEVHESLHMYQEDFV